MTLKAKVVLKKESDLLKKLADTVSTFTEGLADDEGAAVLNDWVAYFEGWRRINDNLGAMNDGERDQELTKEIERLKNFRNSLTGNSPVDEFYRTKVFGADIEDAKRLLAGAAD